MFSTCPLTSRNKAPHVHKVAVGARMEAESQSKEWEKGGQEIG